MEEKTSYKIMKTEEFLDNKQPAIYYKADCGCAGDCGVTIELAHDEEIEDVTMTIWHKLVYCSWWGIESDAKFYRLQDMWYRIKGAVKLLCTGRIKLEEAFLFNSTEQVDAFLAAMKEGREKIKVSAGSSEDRAGVS